MKQIIFILALLIVLMPKANCQEESFSNNLSKDEKIQVLEQIKILENAFKKSSFESLKDNISSDFTSMGQSMPNAIEILKQMSAQMPKGPIKLLNASKTKKELYDLDLELGNFGIYFKSILDSKFKFIKLDYIEDKEQIEETINQYLVSKEYISLPFHLIDGYILIDGEINNRKGKFMFDTGNPQGLLLNNNFLDLKKNNKVGNGRTGSRQQLMIYQSDIANVKIINEVNWDSLNNVMHADFGFIEEGITKDFLGFLGYEFIENYEFIIDYDAQVINLYQLDETGHSSQNIYNKEDVIESLKFTTLSEKQMPVLEFSLANEKIVSYFDTGNQGSINLLPSFKDKLLHTKDLKSFNNGWYGQPNSPTFVLDGLTYNGNKLEKIRNLSILDSDKNEIEIGYQFLKNYKSVWNYKTNTIILLKR